MNFFKDELFIQDLNERLKQGAVISFVTDTVWGVGCLPNNKNGVENIYSLKNRDTSKPLILMSNKIEHLKPFVKEISPKAQNIMDKHFPGALTLIFEKTEEVPSYVTSNQNTVGIRIPNNIFFQELCEVIDGHVLATTSANLSGQPPATNYEEALENIGSNVEFVFQDYGQTCKGLSSTVARVLDDEIKIYRQGEVVLD